MKIDSVGIIGGGAWGTALAQAMAFAGRKVTLWAREDDVVAAINGATKTRPFAGRYA
ncbi:2-dehydropantoate 2-reductase N-terminal domain-containing protein [Hyphomicrobium sp. D-2]|uniref:2-dehydropantoate 2-reductase N-terminal domain-containing protein n=1 Tax=Hyphomicrobium sp. D-2 TaxID=3041621 RepID=UPI0032AF70D2